MNVRDSPLVQLAEGARRPSLWWLAWLVVMVIIVEAPQLGVAIGNAVLGTPASGDVWYPYVAAFGSLAVLVVLMVWVRVKEGRPLATVGFRPGRSWVRLLVGFGIGAFMMSAGVVLGIRLGVYGNGLSTHTVTGTDAALSLLPLTLLYLFQACCQAALVPGYLLQTSARQLPAWVAIIGTSLLVAVAHTVSPLSMANVFLFATFAGLIALQQGSLWLVAGIQGGWNCFQASVFGLPVGGIAAPTALLTLGPVPGTTTVISGGHFGLATGMLATVVLLIATVVAYLTLRRTSNTAAAGSASVTSPISTKRKDQTHVSQGH